MFMINIQMHFRSTSSLKRHQLQLDVKFQKMSFVSNQRLCIGLEILICFLLKFEKKNHQICSHPLATNN